MAKERKATTKTKATTSWGVVASWYDELLEEGGGTYQRELILPNLKRRFKDVKQPATILDLACGQGYFTRNFGELGFSMIGVDISSELIALAKEKGTPKIAYHVSSAHKLGFLNDESVDRALCVLAMQNIKEVGETLKEVARVLKKQGVFTLVLNHPAFRNPGHSSWGYDEKEKVQYRRVDSYISESSSTIIMHPGKAGSASTISFHRPLQYYMKAVEKAGFVLTHLEEWNSHKVSQKGPRQKAEDKARKEIPLFMLLELQKK